MKKVTITSLAMRFYKCHGWVIEDFEPYLKGSMVLKGSGPEGKEEQYYILSVGSQLNIEKMFEDGIVSEDSVINRYSWGEVRHLNGFEAMKSRNW